MHLQAILGLVDDWNAAPYPILILLTMLTVCCRVKMGDIM